MRASIVIPCFNLGDYLQDAVDSVMAQTFTDWELIIVDDGSTDEKTTKVVESIKKDHPEFKVFSKKNSGLADTRNYGIKKASGEYIVCLDADDMLAPDYLEKTAQVLERDKQKKLGFVTTWLREFGERDNLWKTSDYDVPMLLLNNTVHAGSLFRKEVWTKIGGYRKMKIGGYEDWDFWLSMVELGYEWDIVPEALFLYRIRHNSMLVSAKTTHVDIYKDLLNAHHKLFAKYFDSLLIENAKEVKELHESISQKNEVISEAKEYRGEIVSLREEVFRLRDEINSMRNARLLGKIIRARETIGGARQKVAPRAVAHKTRVVVAPFIPGPVRRAAKTQAKKILRPAPKIKAVQNSAWEDGPLVSVIVPYYNRADTIDETLDSLAAQTFADFETIVIDDGSPDADSVKKFDQLSVKWPQFKWVKQKNQGVAATRNNGIKMARGKYIICLDSDDALAPTFIEKCTVLLETEPDVSLATTYMQSFGVINEPYKHVAYNPQEIIRNNMVITAAEYEKSAWERVGGYKPNIGYEDWDFWVSLAEGGFWGKLIPEALFRYRTAMQSRYIGDKDAHWKNINIIKKLHPNFKKNIKRQLLARRTIKRVIDSDSAFINLDQKSAYRQMGNSKPNILIILPWMTFGGAETLIINFCNEVKNNFNLSFVTGLESEHEWEHKFQSVTDRIYHLTNLFDDKKLYVEFVSNYIKTRNVSAVHIIHTSFAFEILEELKRRHPSLKVIVTLFNDRAHFEESIAVKDYIDAFTSDNLAVYNHFRKRLGEKANLRVIPNAINSNEIFNPIIYDRPKLRKDLELDSNDLGVFFVGRLSEEKNPDIFVEVAGEIVKQTDNIHFFMIGDGPMSGQLNKMISKIDNPRVKNLGYQSEVQKYLSAGDIFILPSSIEGFPISILEAMAMKMAVIASDVGAVAEVIESGRDGFVVKPGSAEEIKARILELNSKPKLLAEMKNAARSKIDAKYSNVALGRSYRKLYGEFTE